MKLRGVLLIGLSLLLGLVAFALARNSSGGVSETKIVVAKAALNFGDRITTDNVVLADYGRTIVPAGAFRTLDAVTGPNETRVALRTIVAGEPILASNISANGGAGALSTLIGDGMRAITIAVNDVKGVAGLIHISDRVDVLLTRDDHSQTDILLQNVKVLAIDQHAVQDKNDKPVVPKAVTLEVSPEDAQKLALGGSVGALSLALRNSSTTDIADQRSLSLAELTAHEAPKPSPAVAPQEKSGHALEIVRGTDSTIYRIDQSGIAAEGNPKSSPRQHLPSPVVKTAARH